jgi:hypothetical protein
MFHILRVRLVRVLIAITIAVFAAAQIVSVGAGALLPESSPNNPFAAYAYLKPGEPIQSTNGFHCEHSYNYPPITGSYSYCLQIPDDGFIDWVSVAAKDGVIQRVTFGVHLRYGDLVALFGQAESRRRNNAIASYEWEGVYATSMVRRWMRLSMFTPVVRVVFMASDEAARG